MVTYLEVLKYKAMSYILQLYNTEPFENCICFFLDERII